MSADPAAVVATLVALGVLAGIYLKINSALRQMVSQVTGKGEAREISNNPLNVQATSRPATMDDIKPISDRLDLLEKNQHANALAIQSTSHDNGTKIDNLRDRLDDKLDTMKDTISEIERAVGRLEGGS